MDEPKKSPLIRGKPAWPVRYRRLWVIFFAGNGVLLVGQFVLVRLYGFENTGVLAYSMAMLLWVFGFQVWMSRWVRGHGVSYWRMRDMLVDLGEVHEEAVPCPNCLYPLCELDEADAVFVCPECGCGIRGADAIRAWESWPGYVIPKSWGQAWERRLDGIGE